MITLPRNVTPNHLANLLKTTKNLYLLANLSIGAGGRTRTDTTF
jgi:hypothetical protein